MKATGIVRRIDDLGRVVIPREIRRTMRIKEGDPLEIFTTREGEVVFKKYQPFEEMDWVKAKNLIRAIFPDLHFCLYDDLGERQTATSARFGASINCDDYIYDDKEIKNSENDTIGYIDFDGDITLEDLNRITKLLKEFFSESY